MASHWVVKRGMIIASVVVCGVLGAGIGFPAAFIGFDLGVYDTADVHDLVFLIDWDDIGNTGPDAILWIFVSMSVFGILGAVIGGFFGYRITRSKDK